MNDPIERDDVIKAIDKRIYELQSHPTFKRKNADRDLYGVKKLIINLPSARPRGEWIEDYNGNGWNDYWDYTCSNCGKKYERADAILYKANFCPNCGADMRGVDDGNK